eukprot:238021-Hanusia_phi.AAC.1
MRTEKDQNEGSCCYPAEEGRRRCCRIVFITIERVAEGACQVEVAEIPRIDAPVLQQPPRLLADEDFSLQRLGGAADCAALAAAPMVPSQAPVAARLVARAGAGAGAGGRREGAGGGRGEKTDHLHDCEGREEEGTRAGGGVKVR